MGRIMNGELTGGVLAELVLPERLVGRVVRHPVGVHVVQQVLLAVVLQDLGDVVVVARRVAVGLVRAIAIVGL